MTTVMFLLYDNKAGPTGRGIDEWICGKTNRQCNLLLAHACFAAKHAVLVSKCEHQILLREGGDAHL